LKLLIFFVYLPFTSITASIQRVHANVPAMGISHSNQARRTGAYCSGIGRNGTKAGGRQVLGLSPR
jgi:hypothetical protein